jgi:hypothetical protein
MRLGLNTNIVAKDNDLNKISMLSLKELSPKELSVD